MHTSNSRLKTKLLSEFDMKIVYTILTYVPPVPRDIIFAKYYHERERYGNTKQEA